MTKYIKTGTTEFEQFNETEWNRIYQDFDDPDKWEVKASELGIDRYHGYFVIPTKDGDIRIHDGDWIATGVNGEHWAVTDDVFKKTYAELPVIPKVYADMIEEYKTNHYPLSEIFTEWDWHYDEQEMIARAWLDGYEVAEVDE